MTEQKSVCSGTSGKDSILAFGLPGFGPRPQKRLGQFQRCQNIGQSACLPGLLSKVCHTPQTLDKCPKAFLSRLALASSVLTLQKCHKTFPHCFQGKRCQKLLQKATPTCTAPEQWGHQTTRFLNKAFSWLGIQPQTQLISQAKLFLYCGCVWLFLLFLLNTKDFKEHSSPWWAEAFR